MEESLRAKLKLKSLIGRPSSILRRRCPKRLGKWPTMSCRATTCPWWVNSLLYKNCSFLAAEMGEHTLEEVGNMMGVSRERIRQIEAVARIKMKKKLALRDIDEELAYQQSVAQWNRKDPSPDPPIVREDQANIVHAIGLGDLGVEVW